MMTLTFDNLLYQLLLDNAAFTRNEISIHFFPLMLSVSLQADGSTSWLRESH
jgi:hypothetical protein